MSTPPPNRHPSAASAAVGTKIVATLGPATGPPDRLGALLAAGVDVVRINFSHGSRAAHEEMLQALRSAAEALPHPIAVLGDLCGPKIRLGEVAAGAMLACGDTLRFVAEAVTGNQERVNLNHPKILDDLRPGQQVLIDDGAIRLRVTGAGADEVACRCEVGGPLYSHKGVNLPDSNIRLGALTEKDLEDARWAAAQRFDYLALSFVRSAADVRQLRALLDTAGATAHIVAKIETPQAVANIDAIIDAADAILVARGDLGVEMDVARVPRAQKEIIDRCSEAGKPVIVATQMLQSMIESATPTRAEVSDAANAIVDGADALMLSGETAVGRYPAEAVRVLRRVARETEEYDQNRRQRVAINRRDPGVTAAVAHSMKLIADELQAKALAVWTTRGGTARLLSKHRPHQPVVAFTSSAVVRRWMALYYGVTAVCVDEPFGTGERIAVVDAFLRDGGWARPGDLIVVGCGPLGLERGDTGSVTIHLVGAEGARPEGVPA